MLSETRVINCAECGGKLVATGEMSETLVGYLPNAEGHVHNDNCLVQYYRCHLKHYTKISIRRKCSIPGCSWEGKKSCSCHSGEKFEEWP